MQLTYSISIVGMNAVNSAFRSIEKRAAKLNSQAKRFDGGRARRAGGGGRGMSSQQKLADKVRIDQWKAEQRAAKRAGKAKERAIKAADRAAQKAHRAELRRIEKEKNKRQAAERKVAAQRQRTARAIGLCLGD